MLTRFLSFFPYLEHQSSERSPDFLPVYEPLLGGNEEAYVMDAVRSGWISYLGDYCTRLEEDFATFCQVDHALPTCNGTVSLHLILHALNITSGDEVIVPALTFVATANAVVYTGATPVLADVDPTTWTINPEEIKRLITPRTKAIIPVHLYGHPAPMTEIHEIAERHQLYVIEDAAQSHGATYRGKRTGGLGHISSFSMMANKIVTTGEGGMVTTDDEELMNRCRRLRDHAMDLEKRYWHDEVGFNYRMTNLQAAIGVAQLEQASYFIQRKREIAQLYDLRLGHLPGLQTPVELPHCTNVYWMVSLLVQEQFPLSRDELIMALRERNIDSRPFFHSLDTLPPYLTSEPCPISLRLGQQGINLPSSPKLTDEEVLYICDTILEFSQ
ncbi:MAG: DegT/DnrJ/EryC1/StrS family aminotransferase [Chloroflexota bacterium]